MSAPGLHICLNLPRPDFRLQVDLHLPAQGITVLFGASGSGKTTVLRCVAGLERAHDARVAIAGEVWQDDGARVFVPTHQRALGYVFQEASLFEHLDVMGNLRYGLKRVRAAQADATLDAAIGLLGIGHLLRRRPDQLSGGERQRVGIARALATSPRVLLLDEPLAALDLARRKEILPWLERLRDELLIPMLYVTHSADELARLADHLVVLEQGHVKAAGPVQDVLASVEVPVVAGEDAGVLLRGQVQALDSPWALTCVGFPGGQLWLRDAGVPVGQEVRLRVLARDVSLATEEPRNTSIQNHVRALVESVAADAHPSQVLVRLLCGESVLLARVTRRALHGLDLQPGRPVWALIKSVAVVQ